MAVIENASRRQEPAAPCSRNLLLQLLSGRLAYGFDCRFGPPSISGAHTAEIVNALEELVRNQNEQTYRDSRRESRLTADILNVIILNYMASVAMKRHI